LLIKDKSSQIKIVFSFCILMYNLIQPKNAKQLTLLHLNCWCEFCNALETHENLSFI
jgi:hypothetical protein